MLQSRVQLLIKCNWVALKCLFPASSFVAWIPLPISGQESLAFDCNPVAIKITKRIQVTLLVKFGIGDSGLPLRYDGNFWLLLNSEKLQ